MRLLQRHSQKQKLSQNMQQSAKLLALGQAELEAVIWQEMAQNPLLELEPPEQAPDSELALLDYPLPSTTANALAASNRHPDQTTPDLIATLRAPNLSLTTHLLGQLSQQNCSEADKAIAKLIVADLDEDGYVSPDICATLAAQLHCDESAIERVLRTLQHCDPIGIASRSLQECLLRQACLRYPEDKLMQAMVEKSLRFVQRRDIKSLCKIHRVNTQAVWASLKHLITLNPRPGNDHDLVDTPNSHALIVDAFVVVQPQQMQVVLCDDYAPKLTLNRDYLHLCQNGPASSLAYVKTHLQAGSFFLRSLRMRARTLRRVVHHIAQWQRRFFETGTGLKPLTLQQIGQDLRLHASTICRAVQNKTIHTPCGIFPLKYFFTSKLQNSLGAQLGSTDVRDHIARWIAQEDPQAPLSDEQLVQRLQAQHMHVARRTIAKYRRILNIPSSAQRKIFSLQEPA